MEHLGAKERHQPVKVLDQDVIHRIAAGEVVDRPASVLKELIENSIDAGSTSVKVTIVGGGLKSIVVEDDGWGMSQDDLSLCLRRHATSKIKKIEDLEKLFSLGFRGEALSAISSVSQIQIDSRLEGAEAWVLEANGGIENQIKPSSRKVGTRIEVKNLFYNVPARKKFIKSMSAEARACTDVLDHLAVSYPEVSLSWFLIKDSGELSQELTVQASELSSRVKAVRGILDKPHHIKETENLPEGLNSVELVFWGPPNFFPTQKNISLTVNGRAVHDKRLGYALREAYYGLIPVGVFPAVHVSVEVDPDIIDANIHPQKKELRWPKGFSLSGIVYRLIRPYFDLVKHQEAKQVVQGSFFEEQVSPDRSIRTESQSAHSNGMMSFDFAPAKPQQTNQQKSVSVNQTSNSETEFKRYFSAMRVVGEVGARWIILESHKGLFIVDQHAAHERINFEKFFTKPDLIRSKPLLTPLEITLPQGVVDKRDSLMVTLESFGFEFNKEATVSTKCIELIAVPEADRKLRWSDWLKEVFDAMEQDEEVLGLKDKIKTHVAASLACHGSVRFGQRLDREQIKSLLEDMDRVQWSRYCPHGRPVSFELPHEQLEKSFDR